MRKNNTTLSSENIILFLRNLIGHLTEKEKIITLCLIILILSFTNIILNSFVSNSVSALSYENSVGIGFTFNPTLSVSLSSSDLVISNLTPGSTANSNSINVSVATNASYGYTLSVNASSDDLVHSNNVNTFSSIALDADLSNLTTDNTWGYTASLDNGYTWNNYNGLSSSSSTTLLDEDNNASSGVDFKIAAKAGSTQASGTYTNTITFTAVTKPAPMTLAEAYASEGKTMVNGFYTMQDMTSTICNKTEAIGSQLQVLDIRDYKVYWIAKLADNHCWMTQNLSLYINLDTEFNSTNTDLNVIYDNQQYAEYDIGYTKDNNIIRWVPASSAITIEFKGSSVDDWQGDNIEPHSASKIDDTTIGHMARGNYYNWTTAIASNNSSTLVDRTDPQNSICPKGWRLPVGNEFSVLRTFYNVISAAPIYLFKAGFINASKNVNSNYGLYWSSTVASANTALSWQDEYVVGNNRAYGATIRCIAR